MQSTLLTEISSSLEGELTKLLDAIIPIVSSILWIIAIRLVNRWLPKPPSKDDDNDEIDA